MLPDHAPDEDMSREDWLNLRASLNHDGLKNRLLTQVSRLINVADGKIVADEPISMALAGLTSEWGRVGPQLRQLFQSTEASVSPASALLRAPLSEAPLSMAGRAAIYEYVHTRWLERVSLAKSLAHGQEALSEADQVFELTETMRQESPAAGLRQIRRVLRELTAAITALPRGVEVA